MSAKIADLKIGIKSTGEEAVTTLQELARHLRSIRDAKKSLDFEGIATSSSQGLRQLEIVVTKLTAVMKPLAEQMERVAKGANALKSMGITSFAKANKTTSAPDTTESVVAPTVATAETNISDTASDMATATAETQKLGDAITETEAKLNLFGQDQSMEDIARQVGFTISRYELLSEKLDMVRLKYLEARASGDDEKAISLGLQASQIERQIQAEERLYQTNQRVAETADKASSATHRLSDSTKKLSLSSALAHTSLGKLVSQFFRLLKLKAMRMIVMAFYQSIGEGIKNLYEYSKALNSVDGSRFAETMNQYKSIGLQLKNTVATALAPVLNAILPLVKQFTDYIIIAGNAIARFFAFLNNQPTYTVSKNAAVQWADDTASSAGNASNAVKELQRTILGFDELNVLNSPNNSGGGGGGGGGGSSVSASDMFEEKETGQLTGIWAKIAEWLSILKEDLKIVWGWVQKIYKKLEERGIFDKITEAIDNIVGIIDQIIRTIDESDVIDSLADIIADIAGLVLDIWNSDLVQSIISAVITSAVDDLSNVIRAIKEALETITSLLDGDVGGSFRHLIGTVIEVVYGIADGFINVAKVIATAVMGLFKTIVDWIADAMAKAHLISEDTAQDIKDSAQDVVNSVTGTLDEWGDSVDKERRRLSTAWGMMFDENSEVAGTFFAGLEKMSADSVTKICDAYDEGRYYIKDNKIVFDLDGDTYDDVILHMRGEYAGLFTDMENNPLTADLITVEAEQKLMDLAHEHDILKQTMEDYPIDIVMNGDVSREELQEIFHEYYDVSDQVSSHPLRPTATDEELAKFYNDEYKRYSAWAQYIWYSPVKIGADSSKAQQTMDKLDQYYKGIKLTPKSLPVTNTDANDKINATTGKWNNSSFASKALTATTGKFTGAIDGVVSYWNNTNFKSKGITAYVNLPKGTSVNYYAQGGMVDTGTLFIAGEAGAEMVGNINGRTGVASQGEITGIRQSVESTGQTEARLLAEQNALLRQILAKEGNVTVSTSAIIDGLSRTNRRAGKTVVAMG